MPDDQDDQDDQDSVTREIVIAAPIARVWELLTRPEHLKVWYAFDGAVLDLRPGGVLEHHWKEHGRYRGVLDEVSPPTLLSYRYASLPDADPEPGRQTRVVFRLEPTPTNGTRVQVTESGFAELTLSAEERRAHRDATIQGWSGGLAGLSAHAGDPVG
ncbi:SRPBCC domain-containing protein [Plantactinospora soyae]|uniref:Uncharacterized protein YndB with AHSA1/START domain n=1 Tax=Plantactinospora soyae TaxID=1544732 RepID=A0A927R2S9_9ACTN|nr:SRPBCC domain-containing protein [Plantactinospora soyae]MBE1491098.1 uncharacterized protein YndB with AHSA1/START domain [Plantactinospora soyae]